MSIFLTIVFLSFYSLLLTYTNLSENTIQPGIIIITGISLIFGGFFGTHKIKKNGLINGLLIGAIYMIILYLISSIINANFSLNYISIVMIFIRNCRSCYWRSFRHKYKIMTNLTISVKSSIT